VGDSYTKSQEWPPKSTRWCSVELNFGPLDHLPGMSNQPCRELLTGPPTIVSSVQIRMVANSGSPDPADEALRRFGTFGFEAYRLFILQREDSEWNDYRKPKGS
jgi:hypothetical protein